MNKVSSLATSMLLPISIFVSAAGQASPLDVVEQAKNMGAHVDAISTDKQIDEEILDVNYVFLANIGFACSVLHAVAGDSYYKSSHTSSSSALIELADTSVVFREDSMEVAYHYINGYMAAYGLNESKAAKWAMADLNCMRTL